MVCSISPDYSGRLSFTGPHQKQAIAAVSLTHVIAIEGALGNLLNGLVLNLEISFFVVVVTV